MDVPLLITVAVCLLAILILKWLFGQQNKPPGPWNLPIVGYVPFLGKMPHLELQRLAKKYGDVFSIRLGDKYVVVLNDFQSTKEAFAQDALFGRPPDFGFEMNDGTIKTGAFLDLPWKEHRRLSIHLLRDLGLGKSKMESHIQEEITDLLVEFGKNANKPYCIRDILSSSMSNNIASLVFGKRLKYDDPDRKMLTKAVAKLAMGGGQASWKLFFPFLSKILRVLGLTEANRHSSTALEVRKYAWKEIEAHEKTLSPNNVRDFIDGYLLEMKKRKDDPSFIQPVLHDVIVGFFAAGSETVRVTLEWLILLVAKHQDSQCRIQAEIDEVIGQNRLPAFPDQKDMVYTAAFIMEMMRRRTTLPINLLRYALTDTRINGYFIPKHTVVLSNIWAVHNDRRCWGEDVEEFRPERFLTEDGKALKKVDQYMPFSIGKRSCPGESLAKIEMFLYFVAILQKFNVSLPPGKEANFEGDLGISYVPKAQDIILTKRN